jgi:hypothetical protein
MSTTEHQNLSEIRLATGPLSIGKVLLRLCMYLLSPWARNLRSAERGVGGGGGRGPRILGPLGGRRDGNLMLARGRGASTGVSMNDCSPNVRGRYLEVASSCPNAFSMAAS